MKADEIPLGDLTEIDQTALDALAKRQDAMLARTISWSKVNTGSYNTEGLKTFAPMLAEAFAETKATVELIETAPIDSVKASGEIEGFQWRREMEWSWLDGYEGRDLRHARSD